MFRKGNILVSNKSGLVVKVTGFLSNPRYFSGVVLSGTPDELKKDNVEIGEEVTDWLKIRGVWSESKKYKSALGRLLYDHKF